MSKIFYSKRTQKRAAVLGPKNLGKHRFRQTEWLTLTGN